MTLCEGPLLSNYGKPCGARKLASSGRQQWKALPQSICAEAVEEPRQRATRERVTAEPRYSRAMTNASTQPGFRLGSRLAARNDGESGCHGAHMRLAVHGLEPCVKVDSERLKAVALDDMRGRARGELTVKLRGHRCGLVSCTFHHACKVCDCVSLRPCRRSFLVDPFVKLRSGVPREGELDELVTTKRATRFL